MTELAVSTPTERAEALIRLTERLTVLLDQETALFDAKAAHEAAALQPEKSKLATIYRTETRLAAQDKARLAGLAVPLKAKLKAVTVAFETALAKNGAAVEAMKTVTEGLVKALADEAARQAQAKAGYGPSAVKTHIGALAFNQTA